MHTIKDHIINHKYHVEILPPKQETEKLEADLQTFMDKYRRVLDSGHCICITDNAMGNLAFQGHEIIEEFNLPVAPEQLVIHLNTFHTKENLIEILDACAARKIRYLLLVTGDGSDRIPKLQPADIGATGVESVSSVELLQFVHRKYPGVFETGVAFNHYEPEEHEFEKLERKIAAGATYVITQPVIERHPVIEKLLANYDMPIVLEAWMSKKLHLLSDAVGYPIPENTAYDPIATLRSLHQFYPQCGMYLSLLGFKTQYDQLQHTWVN